MDALTEHRSEKDEIFGHPDHSPLSHHLLHGFTGLPYYPPNDDLVFTLPVDPAASGDITVQTSDGQERVYVRSGKVAFTVGGENAELTLYSTGQPGYFVAFRDTTSGKETYGAGRYLDLDPNEDGTVTIDFNYAYNPYCAYDDAYSCPLPPVENWLRVPIEAGEKSFSAH